MIKRSHIRHFLAVVEAGSFTQAAARIRVTQPTLSSGIADLERLVHARLFVRDRKHIRLTEAGGHFLPIARELERTFRLADSFGAVEAADWPQLKLGLIRSVANPVLECVIAELARDFTIELIEGTDSELRAALGSGRIDLALGLIAPGQTGADVIPLLEEPYMMLVPAGHRLAGEQPVDPVELASEIMIARRSCELLEETSSFFTRHQVRPRFSLRSVSDERCIRMVAAGIGITTAPASLAGPGVVPIRVKGYDYRRTIGLRAREDWLRRADTRLRRAAQATVDALTKPGQLRLPVRFALAKEGGNAFARVIVDDII